MGDELRQANLSHLKINEMTSEQRAEIRRRFEEFVGAFRKTGPNSTDHRSTQGQEMGAGDEEIEAVRLETDRLILRDIIPGDLDGFLAYMADPGYIRHLPLDPMGRAEVQALVERVLLRQGPDPRERYFLAAVERSSGRLIGEAIFKRASGVEGEIGWAVAGPDQGQGLATEIGRALLTFGFGNLRLHRLIARCEVGNHASERVMAKLGMTREGILREHLFARGRWWSSAQWSMLASDCEAVKVVIAGHGGDRRLDDPHPPQP